VYGYEANVPDAVTILLV